MDPTTGRFHELSSETEVAEVFRNADERGWVRFRLGELVSIKGQQFRVVDIGTTHVILRSEASETAGRRETPRG